MILTPGLTFGAYRIVAQVGRGGMGEVYRARDTRLGRDVALKILREDGAADPERVRRFEDEARAASSLNHPNIVVIYEVGDAVIPGESQATRYLAMELLEGHALNEIVAGKQLPTRRFLDIAFQLADGVARAHESGIVHRDLKPSNVVVSDGDHVKILDFGLAKLRSVPDENSSSAPTRDETATAPGTVLGTAGYMSPEQIRGETATAASDQFSLGCIFYEMLTGRRPFSGKSSADVLSSILRDDPSPIAESNPGVPDPISWIVDRCLAKSPGQRYVSTRDLARDLQNLRGHMLESKPRMPLEALPPPRRRWWRAVAAVTLLLLGAGAALLLTHSWKPRPEPGFRRLTFRRGVVWRALFVPNSGNILYTGSWEGAANKSYLASPEYPGNERSLESEDQLPMAFSRDGSQVLVLLGLTRAAINAQGTLAWRPTLGGQGRPILQKAGWADWSDALQRLAVVRDSGSERLVEIRKADGSLERAIFRTAGGISYVRFSPKADFVAFIHHPSRYDDGGEVRIVRTDGSESRSLTSRFERCVGLAWNQRNGDVWFTGSRSGLYNSTLWRATVSGQLRAVESFPDFFVLQDVSPAGDRFLAVSNAGGTEMLIRRPTGAAKVLTWLGSSMVSDISSDGKNLLFTDAGATEKAQGIWMRSPDGGEAVRLGSGGFPRFSPDGRSMIALTPMPSGPEQLVLLSTETGTTRELTTSDATVSTPTFAGPKTLLFVRSHGGTSEVWRMDTDGSNARSLGADGCALPVADPAAVSFVCRGGNDPGALYIFPMERGPGRELVDLGPNAALLYMRWNAQGNQIYAVTEDRLLISIDPSSGAVGSRKPLDLGEEYANDTLLAVALDANASLQAYSLDRFSSGLYIATGFE